MSRRVTSGMVEAGIAALARARKLLVQDEGVVAAVYSAMEERRQREAKLTTEMPAPYQHQAWPAWIEGPNGDRRVFNSAEEVPDGWGAAPPPPAPLRHKAEKARP